MIGCTTVRTAECTQSYDDAGGRSANSNSQSRRKVLRHCTSEMVIAPESSPTPHRESLRGVSHCRHAALDRIPLRPSPKTETHAGDR